ncbi:ABC transporter substrate-binding protein [Cryobacterium sp. TMS1-20-1]|uniref:ABC transporter substrate-binding protein n=1 Tax=Cryobacterium sp. TMS1-20-1 TaxID=1259223 RepID=UPI00141BE2F9|nr:ABC transporter substrate-binding protein [Cryobacterium sp. TMS1-20-1]
MRHAKMIGAAALVALFALSGCAAAGEAPSESTEDAVSGTLTNPDPVSIAIFGSGPASGMERLAFENGFAEDRGVKLDKTYSVVSGKEIGAALVNGSAQFGSLTTMVAQPLIEQGECFRFLTAGERNIYEFIAKPELKLDDFESYPENLLGLKGKRIGVSALGTLGETLATNVLVEAGLKPGDVTFVATGGVASAVAAFQEGQVDATWSFAPQLQIYAADEYTKLTNFVGGDSDGVMGQYIQHVFATTCDYAEKNPEVVQAVCKAVWDAYDFANDEANTKAMGEFFATSLAVDSKIGAAFWKQYSPTFPAAAISKEAYNALGEVGVVQPDFTGHVDSGCSAADPR